jgi:hypothetical protein
VVRTLNQKMGDAHEADIAEWIEGALQKASGSQWHRQGDAKNGEFMVPYPITADGKSTLGDSIGISRKMWGKLVGQTFNQNPAIFLRFYADEGLRKVEADLAVIRAGFFTEILKDARQWREFEDNLSKATEDLPVTRTEFRYFCPTSEEVEVFPGGGFDECCDEDYLHLPLPDGPATEALTRLLSDRLKAKVKTTTGCDCCR